MLLQQRLNKWTVGNACAGAAWLPWRWWLVVAAVLFSRQPDYKVLFSSLTDKDAGAIVAQLTQNERAYRYTEAAGAIWCQPTRSMMPA